MQEMRLSTSFSQTTSLMSRQAFPFSLAVSYSLQMRQAAAPRVK